MSAEIIILPATCSARPAAPERLGRPSALIADIRIGEGSRLRINAFTAAEIGLPLVELRSGALFFAPINLTVEQAEVIAAGLLKAAAKARGEPPA